MSNGIELAAEERSVYGKKVKRLRKVGIVPANLYGHQGPSKPIQLSGAEVSGVLRRGGTATIVRLKIGSQSPVQALVKDVQYDPKTGDVMHVDFYRVAATEKVKTRVPLHFVNEAEAMKIGDVAVQRALTDILVESLPASLPASIQVDLGKLSEVGAMIRVGDLQVPSGVTVLLDPNEVVAGVHRTARVAVEEAEEAAQPAAPAPEEGAAATGEQDRAA